MSRFKRGLIQNILDLSLNKLMCCIYTLILYLFRCISGFVIVLCQGKVSLSLAASLLITFHCPRLSIMYKILDKLKESAVTAATLLLLCEVGG